MKKSLCFTCAKQVIIYNKKEKKIREMVSNALNFLPVKSLSLLNIIFPSRADKSIYFMQNLYE
jgi:hypothetical protein